MKAYGQATPYLENKTVFRDETMHVIKYNTTLNYMGAWVGGGGYTYNQKPGLTRVLKWLSSEKSLKPQ